MSVVVVTGTSTDVGKTIVTAALAARAVASGMSVEVCKPAQTGVTGESDLEVIQRLSSVVGFELARYPDPLAPDVAARRAGLPMLELAEVVRRVKASEAEIILVEGAGGVLVRLGAGGFTILDVAVALDASVVVVTAAGLGALNHAALTVGAVRGAGVECAGTIIGSWPEEPDLAASTNLGQFESMTGVPLLGRVPAGAGAMARPAFASACANWIDWRGRRGYRAAQVGPSWNYRDPA